MAGRVKRRLALAAMSARETGAPPPICALCGRPLCARVEWHHPVPRSQGGRDTVPLHPICHRMIHATFTNAELARSDPTLADIRTDPEIARFLAWLADKPADFHAPVRRRR